MSISVVAARRHTVLVLATLLAAMAALIAFSWSNTARADSYPPAANCAISGTATGVSPGHSVHLVGSGFGAGAQVTLTLDSSTSLGSVKADGNGSFTTTVTVPTSVTGRSHEITASGSGEICSWNQTIATAAADNASAVDGNSAVAATTSPSGLASTGFATFAATAIGVALLGGGAMFIIVGRKRRV